MAFKKGHVPWIKGKHHSIETKQKMSIIRIGKNTYIRTKEYKLKMRLLMLGRKCPWISEWNKKYKSQQMKEKNPMYYVKYREKLSKIMRGRITNPPSLFKCGKDNPSWKGGISPINKRIRMSKKYLSLKKTILEKYKYKCQNCGIVGNKWGKKIKLDMHHILSFSKFPEKRFEINNITLLCRKCHIKTDNYGRNIN